MMNSFLLRVGVIGYGLAGSAFHAPLISVTPGLELAAIVTRDAERQARVKSSYPSVTVLESAEALFAEKDIAIAVIATPNSSHVPFAQAALQAGMHVVIDKPAAPTSADVEGLIRLAQQQKRVLTIYQNRRWDGDFLTVKQLIHQGLLGEIFSFESRFERYRTTPIKGAWREQSSEAGGLLYDLGAHLIDQALQLFGPVEHVYAEVERRRPGVNVDDVVFVNLTHTKGVRSRLYANVLSRVLGPRFQVRGLLGAYEKYGLDPQEAALRAGHLPGAAGWGTEDSSAWGHLSTTVGGLHVDGTVETLPGSYQRFYELLRDAIVQGEPPPVDPVEAVASLRVIEAAFQSGRTGEVVRLA